MRRACHLALGFLALLLTTSAALAQVHPLEQIPIEVSVDSGFVENLGTERSVIFTEVVAAADISWIRLSFDDALLGAAPAGAQPTELRITSLLDGAQQHMRAVHLQQWQNSTAYFNGSAVLLEIIADPGAAPSRVKVTEGTGGLLTVNIEETICGPTDDRILSDDVRIGRLVPVGCTAWIIDDASHCFLTAHHCARTADVMEFHVPLSGSSGAIQHPGPEDQYAVDPVSMQAAGVGVGNDWAYFGCFANTETGLTAYEAQGDFLVLADSAPPVSGQQIRITGYGTTTLPVPNEWNQVQKTHVGPYNDLSGTVVSYVADTTGGNSGSPVINEDDGLAIGIHTHGGCTSGGGANNGTAIEHPGLQDALANPQGVCIPLPLLAFDYPNGLPELLDPDGDTIRVVVSGQNGGTPQPGTGLLHFDAGADGGVFAMSEVSPNVYDAVFPAIECGTVVRFFFSAQTVNAQIVKDPPDAPQNRHRAVSGLDLDWVFDDDFETDMGWSVTNAGGIISGMWQRGVPIGGGDRGDPPTDADGSGQCYLTMNLDGDSDVDGGSTTLTSPVLDATQGDAHIAYWRWFSNHLGGPPGDETLVVEVSDDGGLSWVQLEVVGPTGPDVSGGWFYKSFRIADVVMPTANFRIQFIASDLGEEEIVEAGIDGIRLTQSASGVVCNPPCPADVSGDGAVDIVDLLQVLAAWGDCPGCVEDLIGDDVVDIVDLLDLLAAWGPCT
jgi:hypothetical protein